MSCEQIPDIKKAVLDISTEEQDQIFGGHDIQGEDGGDEGVDEKREC